MSWLFSTQVDPAVPTGPNFHSPVSRLSSPNQAFGPLTAQDTEWQATSSGFIAETQVWYATTTRGELLMCQVIHSSVGLWYPQIQFTFRYHRPATSSTPSKTIWKSINVTNFIVPASPAPTSSSSSSSSTPTTFDRRSAQSDQFTIHLDPNNPDVYTINGKYDDEVEISWTISRAPGVPGWKLGNGPRGGFSYFGQISDPPSTTTETPDIKGGSDGYVIHRFWPRCDISGVAKLDQEEVDLGGSKGVFIHAIQGMRPNLVAATWNFANFQTTSTTDGGVEDPGVSFIQMEFETIDKYGKEKVNVGSLVVGEKLVAVTGGPGCDGLESSCLHLGSKHDPETDYAAPGSILWDLRGPVVGVDGKGEGEMTAELERKFVKDGTEDEEGTYETNGLIEKVDVLGEIPYLVKKFVNYAAGTKPYIYQWLNPAKVSFTLPPSLSFLTNGSESTEVEGVLFNEATFISG